MNVEIDFSPEEKERAFDRIAERYYHQNFGTVSKTDFEILLFAIYIDHCIDKNIPFDDYTLSKVFGISQSRIRTLRVSKELKYPSEDDLKWQNIFADSIKYARYDDVKKLVKMTISDPNVMNELRHFIEQNGWYDEYQLNPKLFQCRSDIFIELCQKLEGGKIERFDDATKEKIESIKEDCQSQEEKSYIDLIMSGAVADGLKGLAISGAKKVFCKALEAIPFVGVAAKAIGLLIEIIDNS